jgi:anti-sigma28 factor (negative regulator of flagellin synthesis)
VGSRKRHPTSTDDGRARRVEELKLLVRTGLYRPEASALARALIERGRKRDPAAPDAAASAPADPD